MLNMRILGSEVGFLSKVKFVEDEDVGEGE